MDIGSLLPPPAARAAALALWWAANNGIAGPGPAATTIPPGPWVYQLQNANPTAIAASGFRSAVIDFSRDGTEAGRYRPSQLRNMRAAGITVLAYLSIGEAEDYRFYWRPSWNTQAPQWLGRTNPDWPGNRKVRYWDPVWQNEVLRPYIARITAQGFDGVYLDIIDAYEYWSRPSSYGPGRESPLADDPAGDEAEAARRMISLVRWIASTSRERSGAGFLVIPQNGEGILRHDRDGSYLRAISGIAAEDLLYNRTRPQPAAEISRRLRFLRRVRDAGKTVLCVDYVEAGPRAGSQNRSRVLDFHRRCRAIGFEAYAARIDRELDCIVTLPGLQPRP